MRKILIILIIIFSSLSSYSQIILDHHVFPNPRLDNNTKLIVQNSFSTLVFGDSLSIEVINNNYKDTIVVKGMFDVSPMTQPELVIDTIDLSQYVSPGRYVIKYILINLDYYDTHRDSIYHSIYIEQSSKIPSLIYDNLIKIYPNPTSGFTTITADNIQQIELLNINGQLLEEYTIKNKSYILDMNNRKKGIYFIKIKTDKGTVTEKIIVE